MRMKSNHDANVKGDEDEDEDEDEDDEETATAIGIHQRVGSFDSSILDRNNVNNTDHENDNNTDRDRDHDDDTQIDETLIDDSNNIKFYENPIQRQLWDQPPVEIHIGWNFIVRQTNHADSRRH